MTIHFFKYTFLQKYTERDLLNCQKKNQFLERNVGRYVERGVVGGGGILGGGYGGLGGGGGYVEGGGVVGGSMGSKILKLSSSH